MGTDIPPGVEVRPEWMWRRRVWLVGAYQRSVLLGYFGPSGFGPESAAYIYRSRHRAEEVAHRLRGAGRPGE